MLFQKGLVKVLFATETFAMVSLILAWEFMRSLTLQSEKGSEHAGQMRCLFWYSKA